MTHALASELETIVGAGGVSRDAADRVSYARDLWPRGLVRMRAGRAPATPPALVVWPRTVEQVAEIVTRARAHGAPVVPFGAGSGVCGGVLPTPATVVVDLKRMREVRVIDAAELECEAEAGVLGQHLEDRLLEAGLTLGHYPSSIMTSTLGGWVAARSAGQCSGRYGKIEDMVLALEMVDGEGRIHRVERDGPAGALVPLVIGSEGTMAIVTAARVRIAPAPETRRFAAFSVPTTAAGIHVLRRVYQAGLRPAVARLYDPVDTALAKRSRRKHAAAAVGTNAKKRQVRSTPSAEARLLARAGAVNTVLHALGDETLGGCLMIFVWETHGPLADAELDVTTRIAHEQGGRDLGDGPAQRWLVRRHAVSYRQSPAFADGLFADTMEVAAPWSRLLGVYHAVREALAPYVVVLAHFSHAYPHGGSIYFTYAGAAHDGDAAITRYETTWRTALAAAIDAGATLSHHHGVGRSKAPAMRREQGAAIELVRRLQLALDPGRILNPGALVPDAEDDERATSLPAARAEETRVHGSRREIGTGLPLPPEEREGVTGDREDVRVDEESQLADASGAMAMDALERTLGARGFTLGVGAKLEGDVASWIARGMPGRRAPDDDPVDDVLVGLEAVLHDGTPITIRPAPRRAVGPDVLALFRGAEERVGRVARAVLRVRPIRPETKRAYRFADEVAARRALRAMCGLGARPLVHRLSGATLSVCFAELPEIGAAMSTLADEVAALHDGVGIAVVGPIEAVTPQPTWPDVLADWNWSSRNAAIPRG